MCGCHFCTSYAWVLCRHLLPAFVPKLDHHSVYAWLLPTHFNETIRKAPLHLLLLLAPFSLFLSPCTFLSEMNASGCVTFAWPLSLVEAFYVVFPSVFFPITHLPLTLPWQTSVFWRLTDCGALTGSAEQRGPGESNPLFLCLSECSFRERLLLESCTSTDINLSRKTCNLFGKTCRNVAIITLKYTLYILTEHKHTICS